MLMTELYSTNTHHSLFAKIVQAEGKGSLLTLLRRRLSYAKTAQTESSQTAFELLRCSLFYAKITKIE